MGQIKKRNGFASGIGFILAAAGSAVGLGNLWSFPYKTARYGGAAFVFIYIISVICIGSIAMIAEIYLGRRAQANPVTAYKKTHKNLGWLGLFAIVIPFFIITYYSVLGGYTVKYTLNSFSGNKGILTSFATNKGEVILFTAIFIILALVVVMGGVKDGIEKASKFLMPALFLLLVGIVIYCLCLGDGVDKGLAYLFNPDFSKLGFDGVLAAMGQAFYSLSLGMGIMVSYGSYTGKKVKVGKSVAMICIFDTLIALLAGMAIFPAVFHFDPQISIDNLKGVGLLFSVLPEVFNSLGVAGQIVSFLFFGMVIIAALTSVISLLEVVTQFIIQKAKIHRKYAILVLAVICFAISIPVSISLGYEIIEQPLMQILGKGWLTFFDDVTNIVLMPICAFGSCLAIGWFIEKGSFAKRLNPMHTFRALSEDGLNIGKFGKIFTVMVKYITPLLIAFVEIFGLIDIIAPTDKITKVRAFNINGLGLVLVALSLLIISIVVYMIFFKNKNTGCNADELEIAEAHLAKKEAKESSTNNDAE